MRTSKSTPMLIVAIAAIAATAPWLLPNYHLHVLTTAGLFILLTSGLNLIHGYIGRLSLGHTAFYGLGGYTAGMLSAKLGLGLLVTLPLAALVTILAGLALGHITLRFRGAQFVLVTLAFGAILHLFANNLVDITGGPMGLPGVATPLIHQGLPGAHIFGSRASFYWLVLGLDVAALYFIWRIVGSPLGDAMIAVREDENLAQAVGINEYRYAMLAFVFGAALAGVAGAVYAHYVSFVSPEIFHFNIMIMILVMVILGSVGTMIGPVIGSVLIVLLLEALRLQDAWREPLFGIILVLATLLFPQGLALLVRDGFQRLFGNPAEEPVASGGSSAATGNVDPLPSMPAGKADPDTADTSNAGDVLLSVQNLTVRFGGLVAVDNVSFEVKRGQIVSLIGPNGAGKTTTLNLVTGFIPRDAGTIHFNGEELPRRMMAHEVAQRGMIRTFQTTRGLLSIPVGKAVETGLHRTLGLGWPSIFKTILVGMPQGDRKAKALALLRRVGLGRDPRELTANLSYGEQRLLEVAVALAADPTLLVLDEPVAGMNPEETARMMKLIRELRDAGVTVLLVEHDMKLVMGLSDHIVVLDHGKRIAQGYPSEIQTHPTVIEAYLGRGAANAAA